uniref:Uncharacterized protein n=1 Tax=Arundo donax TaxID=35708 RepID=A0A0A8YW05_ARUDO
MHISISVLYIGLHFYVVDKFFTSVDVLPLVTLFSVKVALIALVSCE